MVRSLIVTMKRAFLSVVFQRISFLVLYNFKDMEVGCAKVRALLNGLRVREKLQVKTVHLKCKKEEDVL